MKEVIGFREARKRSSMRRRAELVVLRPVVSSAALVSKPNGRKRLEAVARRVAKVVL
jgi:hypothetical protein